MRRLMELVQESFVAYCIAMAVGLALVYVGLALCTGCVNYERLPPTSRHKLSQELNAVALEVKCDTTDPWGGGNVREWTGSGGIVDARHVLTAEHVVACASIPRVHATLPDGTRFLMDVEYTWKKRDVARLVIHSAMTLERFPPPIVASVSLGEEVCIATAAPMRDYGCGTVDKSPESISEEGRDGDVLAFRVFGWLAKRGNSGSFVYDRHTGKLLGVLVALSRASFGFWVAPVERRDVP